VPEGIAPHEVEDALVALPGVTRVHDLHIWSISTTDVALTCHLVMPAGCPGDEFLHGTSAMLHDRFEIGHSTIQVECDEGEACALASADTV
jgi:cobalt-zinc-cadmium efflux system protein